MSVVEPSKSPTTTDPRTPSYLDAVKLLGTGNSTGFFGALVALYYFGPRWPKASVWIIGTAAVYLVGICLFAVTFHLLTNFSIQQAQGAKDLKGIEKLRTWLVRIGGASLVAWWIGTAGAVVALVAIYCIEPVSVIPSR